MSKRFGRQQKRKMRSEIARQQEAMALDRGLLRHQSDKLRRFEDIAYRIECILGPYWIGFDPKPLQVNEIPRSFDIAARQNTSFLKPPIDPIVKMTSAYHRLEVMQSDTALDHMRSNIHVRLCTAAGEVGYATSLHALQRLPRDYFVELITREMAEHLWHSPNFQQEVLRHMSATA